MRAPVAERRRVPWRWALVVPVVALLVALPSAIEALPVPDRPGVTADQVLAAVRASGTVPHSGTAESRGRLDLPDVRRLGGLVALLGGTTRTRVWYAGPDLWRVDEQRAAADVAVYRDPAGTWTWDSTEGTAVRVRGESPVRLPRPADLGPAELGRRLAGAVTGTTGQGPSSPTGQGPSSATGQGSSSATTVTRTGARRIAGRTGLGVSLVPDDPRTLVGRVDLWADEATGLPLRVEVTARGAAEPTTESWWLDLEPSPPPPEVLDFRLPPSTQPSVSDAVDVVSLVDRFAPYELPPVLAGAARAASAPGVGGRGGVGTYGEGWARFSVLPLPRDIARETFRSLEGAALVREADLPRGDALALDTPLLSALVVRGQDRRYLLAGTVVPEVLEQAAGELLRDPPPVRPDLVP